eukprot:7897865-Lingulodinium_polyedra.AAC.1
MVCKLFGAFTHSSQWMHQIAVSAEVVRSIFSKSIAESPSAATTDATDICSCASVVSTSGIGKDEDVAVLGKALGDVTERALRTSVYPTKSIRLAPDTVSA